MSGHAIQPASTRRRARTREAIIDAVARLILARRARAIGVADVIAEARVGRSTFYEHFTGMDAARLAALERPLALIADAILGRSDRAATEAVLRHFWDHRDRARDMLVGRRGERALRLLSDLVEPHVSSAVSMPAPLVARQLAAAALIPVRAWLLGELSAPVGSVAEIVFSGAAGLRDGLQAAD